MTRRLAAQLARTEEAAKKALLCKDPSAKHGAAARLLDADRSLAKLTAEKAEAEGVAESGCLSLCWCPARFVKSQ